MIETDHMTETDHTAERDHTKETEHTTGIGHIVEIYCGTTIKMTIEVTIEMTTKMIIEMTIEKKIIGISKTRDIRENIKIIMKTHMTRIIIELATKTRIGQRERPKQRLIQR